MTLNDRLKRQLVDAARRHYAESFRPSVGTRRPRVLRVVGILVATCVVAGSATAATGVWTPRLGDVRRGHPSASDRPAPRAQLNAFAVLRRAQGDADRDPVAENALRTLSRDVSGVRLSEVRVLQPGDGSPPAVLVPVEQSGLIAEEQDGKPARGASLCLFITGPSGAGGANDCESLADIRQTPPSVAVDGRTYGLVPDGVAAVRLEFADGRTPVTVLARDNVYTFRAGPLEVTQVHWLDGEGQPVTRRAVKRS